MNFRWVVFRLDGKELCRYSINGTFAGEMLATLELLAHENGVDPKRIEIELEA